MNATPPLRQPFLWVALILGSVSLFGAEPIFEDATKSLNLGIGGGQVAWGDFNNDGWEDLHDGSLWINDHGKKFLRFTGAGPSGHGIWGDYNNDGWLDFYSWSSGKLYRNEKGKEFVDITPKALNNNSAYGSNTCVVRWRIGLFLRSMSGINKSPGASMRLI